LRSHNRDHCCVNVKLDSSHSLRAGFLIAVQAGASLLD
jgi:hypothetical protein